MNAGTNDAKRVFLKKGTCSQTFCFLLDREFGHPLANEERAADPLAGGLHLEGQQCGMLWGATLAVGAESYRRHADLEKAMAAAVIATRHLVESFANRARSVNCRDITGCDFSGKLGLAKALLLCRFLRCFMLAGRWAPEAIGAAGEGLSLPLGDPPPMPISCASEVARRMGAGAEEMAMVAGFAGGIGLSGNGCGALAAAIWLTTLERVRRKNWTYSLSDPVAGGIVRRFRAATGSETVCRRITGKRFHTLAEHARFIADGGCDKLIDLLARA